MLAPSIGRARASAIQTQCASNMRQCVNAMLMYADNSQGWITTYGPASTGWYRQPGIPATLGFSMPSEPMRPRSYRAVTICPGGGDDDIEWYGNIAYGAPFFALAPQDYSEYNCEHVLNTSEQYVNIHAMPEASTYVMLADSAYTKFESRSQVAPGVQCLHFSRRDEGKASPINSAVCERHNGVGNLAFADGHVSTTADKANLFHSSKIGAYVDPSGNDFTFVEE